MSACARCQRSDDPKDWLGRGEIVNHGLALCYRHDIEMRSDMDRLERLDDSDPERAHGLVDEVLLRWAPRPLADAVRSALARQPWVAGA